MSDATVYFELTVLSDEGDDRSLVVSVDCHGSGLPERIVQHRSVAADEALHHDELLAPVLTSMIEAGAAAAGAVPIQHHAAVAAALGLAGATPDAVGDSVVEMLGTDPLRYPAAGSLTGKKKARTVAELPPIPAPDELTDTCRAAQPMLRELVEAAGGRLGFRGPGNMIGEGHIDVFVPVMREWAEHYGTRRDGGIEFSRPGLWHALERLYPLQDPNRIDRLRKAVIVELQRQGWHRKGVRSSKWWIPD
jgi:hypothetical protein